LERGTASNAVVSGIGDLILDHLRRLAGIFGVDDDLRVGEIRDGVERRVAHGIDAGEGDEGCRQQSGLNARFWA
jgi:hypothetical protein